MSHQVSFCKKNKDFFSKYILKHKIRFVTATALFDGHDASINMIRRLIQARGGEVVHLGHSRCVQEVAQTALQEDVQAIAVSSYQGGHTEYFKYLKELLNAEGAGHIRIFGGGGGVITLKEIEYLESCGITKIYSPEDGQSMGLDGMIGHMLYESDFSYTEPYRPTSSQMCHLARDLTFLENAVLPYKESVPLDQKNFVPVLGVTGTGGAGKSSLLDELLLRFLQDYSDLHIAVICVDPSKKKTGGALLGDRIRVNSASSERIFLRSLASRNSSSELASAVLPVLQRLRSENFGLIILETSGIGQSSSNIVSLADVSLYVMTPEYGAASQLEKIDMLDYADVIAVNKFERRQGPDALRDVKAVLRRGRFFGKPPLIEDYPVFGTIASRFNDDGVNGLYKYLVNLLQAKTHTPWTTTSSSVHLRTYAFESTGRSSLIPAEKEYYLADIAKTLRDFKTQGRQQIDLVKRWHALHIVSEISQNHRLHLQSDLDQVEHKIEPEFLKVLKAWPSVKRMYENESVHYLVRGKEVTVSNLFSSLAGLSLKKVMPPPHTEATSELARYIWFENMPGCFPFTCGVFPFRRSEEDPKRQFAGEGGPDRTNKRFHFLSKDDQAKRLSTAFDSVTLYGSEPHERADIYGKIGESGVSVAHLDDMKVLYQGFDLMDAKTSVSMTINGPAPVILAMFFNVVIHQALEKQSIVLGRLLNSEESEQVAHKALQLVRGTVQADILKEDQAQNTCIFSTEFALKLMGDMQEFLIKKGIKNYYGVSISGYHIAEAGANPITQLAFTLANGFTYVEYYLARGFHIDDFASNLSFFFSNGLDPEYTVIGRVARRIWAVAMRDRYGASEASQKLKYHIQTSGRSLHAQEMDFNDIRTTLQALLALQDNCNSLHTNAYDEALTTPTEESVRRAMAIQMIIQKEFGLGKVENFYQGSYWLESVTDLVEEAVLDEFLRISDRGGVLGAMETQYQRNKIQEESMHYEYLKHSGELPLIGVNTYLNHMREETPRAVTQLIRASYDEKNHQITRLMQFKTTHSEQRVQALERLSVCILSHGNIFEELMYTVRYCSLGEITEALYGMGGKYRRSM